MCSPPHKTRNLALQSGDFFIEESFLSE